MTSAGLMVNYMYDSESFANEVNATLSLSLLILEVTYSFTASLWQCTTREEVGSTWAGVDWKTGESTSETVRTFSSILFDSIEGGCTFLGSAASISPASQSVSS